MRIRIIGAGSIGLLLAGRLAASGAAVQLVTSTAEQALQLGAEGVTVQEPDEQLHAAVEAIPLEWLLAAIPRPDTAPDWTLLTVKQMAIDERLLTALSAIDPPHCGMVCWQNGIGHLERIANAVRSGSGRLYAAVTTEGARRLSPASVAHTGRGRTEIGSVKSSHNLPPAAVQCQKKLVEVLSKAGFTAVMSKHILTSVWNKLLVNAAVNPLTAIVRKPNGALLQSDRMLELMRALAAEAQATAAAEGISTAVDIERRITDVCRATALNRSSMLQDLEAGRTTENEWISGAIVRLAAKHGLDVPVTQTIYRIVHELEKGW